MRARGSPPALTVDCAVFGMDVKLPGLLVAKVVRSPVFGTVERLFRFHPEVWKRVPR